MTRDGNKLAVFTHRHPLPPYKYQNIFSTDLHESQEWSWRPKKFRKSGNFRKKSHAWFIALSYQNCRRSSRKYEKMAKNDQFITRTSWAENRSTTKHMPGRYFFQDASTIAISWWSDIGKVVKKGGQTYCREVTCRERRQTNLWHHLSHFFRYRGDLSVWANAQSVRKKFWYSGLVKLVLIQWTCRYRWCLNLSMVSVITCKHLVNLC